MNFETQNRYENMWSDIVRFKIKRKKVVHGVTIKYHRLCGGIVTYNNLEDTWDCTCGDYWGTFEAMKSDTTNKNRNDYFNAIAIHHEKYPLFGKRKKYIYDGIYRSEKWYWRRIMKCEKDKYAETNIPPTP